MTPVTCSGSVRHVSLTPKKALIPGEHYVVTVNPASSPTVADLAGNLAAHAKLAFRGGLVQQENSPAAHPVWDAVKVKKALGGSYAVDHLTGASTSWQFTGSSVKWVTVTGPTFGIAKVAVDGNVVVTYNDYASGVHYGVTHTIKGLTSAKHTVTVKVTGRKGSKRAKGAAVAVDAFSVGGKVTKTPSMLTSWATVGSAKASGGRYAVADLKGASVSMRFRGTAITWVGLVGRHGGKVKVFLDGHLKMTVDTFAKATKFQVAHTLKGLVDKRHTLRLVVTGTHRSASKGSLVSVDAFKVK
jgi:hypothetical protein